MGYPDGWNNSSYCNNSVMNSYDWLGASTTSNTTEVYFPVGKSLLGDYTGLVSFTIKAIGSCNDDYDAPSISLMSTSVYGSSSEGANSFDLGGTFFLTGTITISDISGTIVANEIKTTQAGTKIIASTVYVTYKLSCGSVSETRATTLKLIKTIKE